MPLHLASRGFSALLLAPLVVFGGCDHYDVGDLIDAIDEGGQGHGHAGSPGCVVAGVRHRPGDSFPSSDGCNQCFCGEDGQVGCTLRFCVAACGGIQGLTCPNDQYCAFPPEAQCGSGDQTGICESRPEICTREFRPVCGCDGVTYGNACTAAAAGASVIRAGECNVGPHCRADSDCPVPPCACLDENGDGMCENECPVPICRDGVCGVGSPGASQLGDTCGGFRLPNAANCDQGLFCQHQPGALCGAADAPGECVLIPAVCADIFDPVCGCDGQTYGNACEAAANLTGIFERGPCQTSAAGAGSGGRPR
jgi:Kazal-type serine protease inhibitor domain/Pacifastin inhibitor (LCMII)